MTITIAKLLDRREYDVRFVVIGKEIGDIGNFIPQGYPLSLIKVRNGYDFTAIRIYRYLRGVVPQYVFCSLIFLFPHVIIAARWLGGCKIIIRWNCAVERVSGITKSLIGFTLHKANVVIAQTEMMQGDIEKSFPRTKGLVITLHNLIDKDTIRLRLENADNPYEGVSDKVIVWIGRFNPVKCVEVLIDAFVTACNENRHISLYLVGKIDDKNNYYKTIKRTVEESEFRDKIHFVGFQDNPYKWMKYADCLVLSSRSEASPNALFEGLYLGKPVVSTRCTPNIDDIIQDGVNGYKVNVGDATTMAGCLLKAIDMKEVKMIHKHSSPEGFIQLFK